MRTIGLVAFVRLGVWLLPFRKIQQISERLGRVRPDHGTLGIREIVWAVRLASRYVPQATCLTQALSTQILLGRNGHAAQTHIGVSLTGPEGFRAHAWVEHEGKVLIGRSEEFDCYAPILVLEGKTSASACPDAAPRA